MAPLLAPYNSSMRVGSGFNSYTQQLCVDHAVVGNPDAPPVQGPEEPNTGVPQSVVFKTSIVDKMSDITDALNISGALAIKYNNLIDGTGKGTFVNSNKIKDADINLLISVRVINQTVHDYSLTEFSPIPDIDTSGKFTEIYGDCFISGFQEGGEFNAIVSIKVKDQNQKEDIAADAAISLTTPSFGSGGKDKKKDAKPKEKEKGEGDKNSNTDETGSTEGEGEEDSKDDEEQDVSEEKREPASSKDPGGLSVKGNAEVKKERQDILKENETTISVTWSGGGQELKEPDEDWNVEILRKAALRFPEMVAKTPVRTHSILTKYTSLKSYNAQRSGEKIGNPLSYENAGLYTTILQDVFLDYKNLFKDITLLEADVDAGKKKLTKSEFNETPLPQLKSKAGDGEGQSMTPKPFDPTFTGLECAKLGVRHMMNMIVAEVDVITKDPSIANKDRTLPCECPTIFRQYLPVNAVFF